MSRPHSSPNQFTPQDPTQQYAVPQEEGTISYPGTTQQMRTAPDHGEETYRGHDRLAGRRAVVTGGDSGIGRAVALAFAREGADVLITYLPGEEEDAQRTVDLVRAAGRRSIAIAADLRDEQQCQEVVETAVNELGGLDILVNNAAYQMAQPGGILDITTEQFDRVMKTNMYAMFWLCKASVPHLKAGATIINTSSIQAFQPSPELLDYAATKAGIVNFTKALGEELADQGIRVNSVAPGPVWTPLIPATMNEEKVASFGEQTPLGRPAQPGEIAPAFVFLASQESGFITSEVIAVTGGKVVV